MPPGRRIRKLQRVRAEQDIVHGKMNSPCATASKGLGESGQIHQPDFSIDPARNEEGDLAVVLRRRACGRRIDLPR